MFLSVDIYSGACMDCPNHFLVSHRFNTSSLTYYLGLNYGCIFLSLQNSPCSSPTLVLQESLPPFYITLLGLKINPELSLKCSNLSLCPSLLCGGLDALLFMQSSYLHLLFFSHGISDCLEVLFTLYFPCKGCFFRLCWPTSNKVIDALVYHDAIILFYVGHTLGSLHINLFFEISIEKGCFYINYFSQIAEMQYHQ